MKVYLLLPTCPLSNPPLQQVLFSKIVYIFGLGNYSELLFSKFLKYFQNYFFQPHTFVKIKANIDIISISKQIQPYIDLNCVK